MKLIIAIVRDHDSEAVTKALTSNSFGVTGIASSGGFLRRGKSTLLVGLDDSQVEQALQVIRQSVSTATDNSETRAVMFVLPVDNFEHF